MIRPFTEITFDRLSVGRDYNDHLLNKGLIVLAESEKGELLEPVVVHDLKDVMDKYEEGNLVELVRSVYQITGEIPIKVVRVDWESPADITHLLRYIDFRYILMDPKISISKDFDLILRMIDVLKENLEYGHKLSNMIVNVDVNEDISLIRKVESTLRDLYSYGETNAGIFVTMILDQAKEYCSNGLFAGLLIAQDITESPRNKPLARDVDSLIEIEHISEGKELILNELSVNTIRDSYHHGPVFIGDNLMSTADKKSQYRLFTNLKVVSYVLDFVNYSVGRLRGMITQDGLREVDMATSVAVNALISRGIVKDIQYTIIEEGLGKYHLILNILPHFSIHYIEEKTRVGEVID